MAETDLMGQMSQNNITWTSDGLLKDFVARKLYRPAMKEVAASITRRTKEITYLRRLEAKLANAIEEESNEN